MGENLELFDGSLVAVRTVNVPTANELLLRWGHRLGALHRPFRMEAYALIVGQHPVSVAMSASIVSPTVAGYTRQEVVECARLCSDPQAAWATRIMLRLWREVCAPRWTCWPVKAAISYSHNGHGDGRIYLFDGWQRLQEDCGSSGGGTWTRKRAATDAVMGKKTLWIWCYQLEPLVATLRG